MASRKLRTALAYGRLVPKRELVLVVDEVISIRLEAHIIHQLFDILVAYVIEVESVADIFTNNTRKQHRLLLYYSYLVMVPLWIEFLDVDTIKKNFSFFRVVEALDQLDYR